MSDAYNKQAYEMAAGRFSAASRLLDLKKSFNVAQQKHQWEMEAEQRKSAEARYNAGYKPQTQEEAITFEQAKSGAKRNIADLSDLTPEQQLQARSLSRKLHGVRGAEYGIPPIAEQMRQGKTIDQIEDTLRFAGQSPEFAKKYRLAAQSIFAKSKLSGDMRQIELDSLDDLNDDPEAVKEQLKQLSRNTFNAQDQSNIFGMERTVEFLNEIKDDLIALQKGGVPPGIFNGTEEEINGKVGRVAHPGMRNLAIKIAAAVIEYRRAMTGVQFGMKEHSEYQRIFPSISRFNSYNMEAIAALTSTFNGKIRYMYKATMGPKNYKEIFENVDTGQGGQNGQPQDEYSKYLQVIGGQ